MSDRLYAYIRPVATIDESEVRVVRLSELRPDMVLERDVHARSGMLIVRSGGAVTPSLVPR